MTLKISLRMLHTRDHLSLQYENEEVFVDLHTKIN